MYTHALISLRKNVIEFNHNFQILTLVSTSIYLKIINPNYKKLSAHDF